MRKIICIIFLLVFSVNYAQDNLDDKQVGDTIFYKNSRHVSQDIAKEFVVIDSITQVNGKNLYAITAYDIKDIDNFYSIRKYTTSTTRLEIVDREGMTTYFHKNGKVRSQGLKKNGRSIGKWHYWYDDENKHMEITFFERDILKKGKSSLIMSFWDTKGEQTVKDGNGEYFYVTERDSTLHQGKLVAGEKDGLWIGRYKDASKYYDENYKNGKLMAGESWDKKGNHYTYKEEFIPPQFKGGQDGIRKIIVKNFRVPKIVIEKKIEGTVLVSFDVDIKGNIINVKAFRKVHPAVDAEAIRVVKRMKSWKPATKKGKKVKSNFAIPITYRVD